MGRPESSVDVGSGPVARLAWDLRALRQDAGTPSYRVLAARANYSATVLSRAAGGREFPSLPVVLAYATACGGDPAEWEARWQAVASELADGGTTVPATLPGGTDERPRVIVVADMLRSHSLALVALLATAALAGWAMAFAGMPGQQDREAATKLSAGRVTTDVQPTATIAPPNLSDGNDPTESGCARGAATVAQATLRLAATAVIAGKPRPAGTTVGLLELRYSARCHAAWARATPSPAYNVNSLGSIVVTISRQGDTTYSTFRIPVMTVVYGDLLLTRHGCVAAAAEFLFAKGGRADARTSCWGGS